MSTRRNFLKGAIGATAGIAVIAPTVASAVTSPEIPPIPLELDARKCPDCNSPMAECLEPEVWTCLFCNNDKWYRFLTVSGRRKMEVPAGPPLDNINVEGGPFRPADPNARVNTKKWRLGG